MLYGVVLKIAPHIPILRMGSKPSKPMPWMAAVATRNEERLAEGTKFLTIVWQSVAAEVIETAVRVYELSPEQATALRSAFGRVPYVVEAT